MLAAACNPDPLLPPTSRRAAADEVVQAAPGPTYWEGDDPDVEFDDDPDAGHDAWDDEPIAPSDDAGWEYHDADDRAWDGRAVGPPEARGGRAWRAAPEPGALHRSRRRQAPLARGGRR